MACCVSSVPLLAGALQQPSKPTHGIGTKRLILGDVQSNTTMDHGADEIVRSRFRGRCLQVRPVRPNLTG